MSDATTEADRVLAALAGDMTAVEALYLRFFGPMVRMARQYGASPEDATDVVHHLFAQLVEGRGWSVEAAKLPPDGQLTPFLQTMVKFRVWALHAHDKYHGSPPESDEDILVPFWGYHFLGPEDQALRRERLQILSWAIASLPRRLRQVARLRYHQCLSGPAIAAALGLQPATIPTYLQTIRTKLRPVIADVYQLTTSHARVRPTRFGNGHHGHRHSDAAKQRIREARRRRKGVAA